jgi:hypothetical protein
MTGGKQKVTNDIKLELNEDFSKKIR